MYCFTFAELGVPRVSLFEMKKKFQNVILRPRNWFFLFFPPGELVASCEKVMGF